MRKELLAFVIILNLTAAKAQYFIGIKAGANFNEATNKNAPSPMVGKTGFYAGGWINLPVINKFHIQPEVLWSTSGYKYTGSTPEFTTTFNYIHLLALAQYSSKRFYMETGPQCGFLLSVINKGWLSGTARTKDSFSPTVLSWVAGVGYRLQRDLGLNARYVFGIGSIANMPGVDIKFNQLTFGFFKTFNLPERKK